MFPRVRARDGSDIFGLLVVLEVYFLTIKAVAVRTHGLVEPRTPFLIAFGFLGLAVDILVHIELSSTHEKRKAFNCLVGKHLRGEVMRLAANNFDNFLNVGAGLAINALDTRKMRTLAVRPVFALVVPAVAFLAAPRRSAFLFAFGSISGMSALRFVSIDDSPLFVIVLAAPCYREYVRFNRRIIGLGGPGI